MKKMICGWLMAVSVLGASAETWKGACEISFTVTETMNRKFSGTGAAEPFTVEVAATGNETAASWKAEVQPAKLSTQKEARDKEMWKMFRLAEFPVAAGEVKSFNLAQLKKAATEEVEMPFTLTIIGVPQELKAKISNVKEEGGKTSFDADFTVDMKSFTLKPKVLLGMFKVHNEVPVRASFTLTR